MPASMRPARHWAAVIFNSAETSSICRHRPLPLPAQPFRLQGEAHVAAASWRLYLRGALLLGRPAAPLVRAQSRHVMRLSQLARAWCLPTSSAKPRPSLPPLKTYPLVCCNRIINLAQAVVLARRDNTKEVWHVVRYGEGVSRPGAAIGATWLSRRTRIVAARGQTSSRRRSRSRSAPQRGRRLRHCNY
jgi:hypothetical protein